VRGGQPTSQRIVVHARQVIVNERVGVNQLDRSCDPVELGSVIVAADPVFAFDCSVVRSHGEQRPDPLAAGANRVRSSRPHRRPERFDQPSDRGLQRRPFDRNELFDAIHTHRD
jgi:hypothetical protein